MAGTREIPRASDTELVELAIPAAVYCDPVSGDRIVVSDQVGLFFSRGDLPDEFCPLRVARRTPSGAGYEFAIAATAARIPHATVVAECTPDQIRMGAAAYGRVHNEAPLSLRVRRFGDVRTVAYAFLLADGRAMLITAPAMPFSYAFEVYLGPPAALERIDTHAEWDITRFRDGGTTYMTNSQRRITVYSPSPSASLPRGKRKTTVQFGRAPPQRVARKILGNELDIIKRAFQIPDLAAFGVYDLESLALPLPSH